MTHKQLIAAFLFIVTNSTINAMLQFVPYSHTHSSKQDNFVKSIRNQNTNTMLQLVPHSPTSQSREDALIQKIRAQNTRVTLPHQKKSATTKNYIRHNQPTPHITKKDHPRDPKNHNVHKKIYVCAFRVCYKTFARQLELDRHKVVHTGKKPFVCQHCKFKFSFECNLTKHVKNQVCK